MATAALALCLALPALAQTPDDDSQFVEGTYQLIGRKPDSNELYSGSVTLTRDDQGLRMERTVHGHSVPGSAHFEEATADKIPVLVMQYQEHGTQLRAYCTVASDLDNYPRITCLTGQSDTRQPGIEALFIDPHHDAPPGASDSGTHLHTRPD